MLMAALASAAAGASIGAASGTMGACSTGTSGHGSVGAGEGGVGLGTGEGEGVHHHALLHPALSSGSGLVSPPAAQQLSSAQATMLLRAMLSSAGSLHGLAGQAAVVPSGQSAAGSVQGDSGTTGGTGEQGCGGSTAGLQPHASDASMDAGGTPPTAPSSLTASMAQLFGGSVSGAVGLPLPPGFQPGAAPEDCTQLLAALAHSLAASLRASGASIPSPPTSASQQPVLPAPTSSQQQQQQHPLASQHTSHSSSQHAARSSSQTAGHSSSQQSADMSRQASQPGLARSPSPNTAALAALLLAGGGGVGGSSSAGSLPGLQGATASAPAAATAPATAGAGAVRVPSIDANAFLDGLGAVLVQQAAAGGVQAKQYSGLVRSGSTTHAPEALQGGTPPAVHSGAPGAEQRGAGGGASGGWLDGGSSDVGVVQAASPPGTGTGASSQPGLFGSLSPLTSPKPRGSSHVAAATASGRSAAGRSASGSIGLGWDDGSGNGLLRGGQVTPRLPRAMRAAQHQHAHHGPAAASLTGSVGSMGPRPSHSQVVTPHSSLGRTLTGSSQSQLSAGGGHVSATANTGDLSRRSTLTQAGASSPSFLDAGGEAVVPSSPTVARSPPAHRAPSTEIQPSPPASPAWRASASAEQPPVPAPAALARASAAGSMPSSASSPAHPIPAPQHISGGSTSNTPHTSSHVGSPSSPMSGGTRSHVHNAGVRVAHAAEAQPRSGPLPLASGAKSGSSFTAVPRGRSPNQATTSPTSRVTGGITRALQAATALVTQTGTVARSSSSFSALASPAKSGNNATQPGHDAGSGSPSSAPAWPVTAPDMRGNTAAMLQEPPNSGGSGCDRPGAGANEGVAGPYGPSGARPVSSLAGAPATGVTRVAAASPPTDLFSR